MMLKTLLLLQLFYSRRGSVRDFTGQITTRHVVLWRQHVEKMAGTPSEHRPKTYQKEASYHERSELTRTTSWWLNVRSGSQWNKFTTLCHELFVHLLTIVWNLHFSTYKACTCLLLDVFKHVNDWLKNILNLQWAVLAMIINFYFGVILARLLSVQRSLLFGFFFYLTKHWIVPQTMVNCCTKALRYLWLK